jgi:hypothetical protein
MISVVTEKARGQGTLFQFVVDYMEPSFFAENKLVVGLR